MSRHARACAVVLAAIMALAFAGCGSDSGDTGTTKGSGGTHIDITFKGSTVTPEGKSVKVKAGEPLELHITADKAGEIHVHSSPEQHIEYGPGTTNKTLTIDQPGVVDVESHTLDKLILQVQVR